jgi:hypothetical protein
MDLGGGVQMMDMGSTLQNAISLQTLKAQNEGNQLTQKKLEIETALKANELLNLNVSNLLQKAQLTNAIGDEQRAQSRHAADMMKQVYDLIKVNPQMGVAVLQRAIPDASATVTEDGMVSIEWPTMEKKSVEGVEQMVPVRDKLLINIDPKALDPEKKSTMEGQWADRFNKMQSITDFRTVEPYYKNFNQSIDEGTGQGDVGAIFSLMKMYDPGSRVTAGELATAQNTGSIPQQIWGMYNKALKEDAPMLGEKGGKVRKNFKKSAEIFYQNFRKNALMAGRDVVDMAARERLSARNILSPVGDIKEDDFLMTDDEAVRAANGAIP